MRRSDGGVSQLRRVLLLVAFAAAGACHHAAPGKADLESDLPHPTPLIDAAVAVAPPVADDWKVPPPAKALDGAGPHAFVADGSGLVEVAPGGTAATMVVTPGTISWCNVDARGQVVWFTRDNDFFAFDLVDRSVHRIVHGAEDSPLSAPVIAYDNQQLGGESKVDFQLALSVNMATPPTLSVAIGCDGDGSYYCYADPAADEPVLNGRLTDERAALLTLTIADPTYLGAVAARGKTGSLWTPPPMPPKAPAKKPKINRAACEDPTACGTLSAIPGNPLWIVVVGNSRGDFYHEDTALWDPSTNEYVDFSTGTLVRSKNPPSGTGELGGMRSSTRGGLTIGGTVFDAKRVYYAPTAGTDAAAVSCGWTDGWRIRGPRE